MGASRLEPARRRARAAKLSLGVASAALFAVALPLARVHYAGHHKSGARSLDAPQEFRQAVQDDLLRAGIMAPGRGTGRRSDGALVRTHQFESMGCEVVVGGANASGWGAVEALFRHYDGVFSRFRPDSELNRVNAAAGTPVAVSSLFARALAVALDAAEQTGGLVDPTLGAALEAAGYDRDFALLAADDSPPGGPQRGSYAAVRVHGRLVRVTPEVRLDLNGVVKALAVDDALGFLDGQGYVSAGGDVAANGPLTVALPGGGAVRLLDGGLATSGCAKRAWSRGGRMLHHLIDPRTGRPVESPWEQVTVCGATCLAADIGAKAAFVAGAEGPAWLDAHGLPGRFVDAGGGVLENSAWRARLTEAA